MSFGFAEFSFAEVRIVGQLIALKTPRHVASEIKSNPDGPLNSTEETTERVKTEPTKKEEVAERTKTDPVKKEETTERTKPEPTKKEETAEKNKSKKSVVSEADSKPDLDSESVGQEKTEKKDIYWLCKSGKEVRSLRLVKKNDLCVSSYTKLGLEQVVAKSTAYQTCFDVIKKIRSKIETSNWSCRDISGSRVSNSF